MQVRRYGTTLWRGAWGGMMAGIVAGAVLVLLGAIVSLAESRDLWSSMKFAGTPFLGERAVEPGFEARPVLIGLLGHFAVSIGWGLLFGLLAHGLGRSATVVFGGLWGLVVWQLMYYVLLPIAGMGEEAASVPVGSALFQCVLYGLILGVAFAPLQSRQPRARPGPPRERAAAPGRT